MISFKGVFAGLFISLIVYAILMTLGMAVGGLTGAAAIEAGEGGTGLSVGAGIWLVLSVCLSLFTGSWVAARACAATHARFGIAQGLVTASMFFALMALQVGMTLSLAGKGVEGLMASLGAAANGGLHSPKIVSVVEGAMTDLDLEDPVDEVVEGVTARIMRGDIESAKAYLAHQAGISTAEANTRIAKLSEDFKQTVKEVGATTARVVSATGWSLLVTLLFGTVLSAVGGGIGVARQEAYSDAEWERTTRAA